MYALISNSLTIHCTITNTEHKRLQGVIIGMHCVGTTNKEYDSNIEDVSYILDLKNENEKLFLTIQFDVFNVPSNLRYKNVTAKLESYKKENTESKDIQEEWFAGDKKHNSPVIFVIELSFAGITNAGPEQILSARAHIYCFNFNGLPLINQVEYFRKFLEIEGKTIHNREFRFCFDFELVAKDIDDSPEIQMKVETKPFYFIGDEDNQTIELITEF
ncbi:hypothetical protein CDIK_2763 [Cucumispora dikerogammari]|nr:hypothetical protein CDIK_2763 [Cucumispora dikerogammari]